MSTEDLPSTPADVFSGDAFKDAREHLGLGLDQLSRELHLPSRTLQAIEKGELDTIGGPVFVRGYIRTYARRLELDADHYARLYDRSRGVKEIASAVKEVGTVSTTPARQSRSLLRFGSLVFIAAMIGVVVWWWQTQYSIDSVLNVQESAPVTVDTADGNTLVLPTLAETEPSEDLSLSAVESTPAAEAPIDSLPSPEAVAVGESPEGAEPVATEPLDEAEEDAALDAAVPPVPPVVEETAISTKGLHLVLTAESWLSVHDAQGSTLYNGIASAGSDLNFTGEEPLRIVIGRASAVSRIEYAGEPVDLEAVNDKNVARLTLPR